MCEIVRWTPNRFQLERYYRKSNDSSCPVYQRTYAWTVKDQLTTFFEQVKEKASDRLEKRPRSFSHYMGALIVIPEGDAIFGHIQAYNVVDGQQRLTTFHLFYAALRDLARELGAEQMARQLHELLVIPEHGAMGAPDDERYKLNPTRRDRQLTRDIVDLTRDELRTTYPDDFYTNGKAKDGSERRPLAAWSYFRHSAEEFVKEENGSENIAVRLLALSTALYEDFRLIVITLDKDDDAQVIFQTLHFGGKPLAAMDLVRNDVFHRAKGNEDYVEKRWSVFDVDHAFWTAEGVQGRIKKPRYDFYLAHTLAAEGQDVSLGELYTGYRRFIDDASLTEPAAQLDVLTRYAGIYRKLVEPQGADALGTLARRLVVFDVSTAYPLIFVIAESAASPEDKSQAYELVASYIIRRALCYLTPKSYNKTFVSLAGALRRKGISAHTLAGELIELKGDTERFPSDDELRDRVPGQPLYGWIARPRLRRILIELELATHDKFDESAGIKPDLTIEHILPDSWREHWPLPDGRYAPPDANEPVDESMRVAITQREKLKHTLGNLTLLTPAANPSLGKASFEDKKTRLQNSLLKMNHQIAARPTWDESAIQERSRELTERAIKLWPHPSTWLGGDSA